ncbi:TolC family protein [Microseira sp. BLCC-F43]|jgi:OMF family outer membrane factor|uniref:TolC family protein n=1 Tax=Microseira sp. BLCC-F43 TaxID=3153602 RepID=UPI0035B990F0
MSTFRNFVVVSVSAAIVIPNGNAIAIPNTPGFALDTANQAYPGIGHHPEEGNVLGNAQMGKLSDTGSFLAPNSVQLARYASGTLARTQSVFTLAQAQELNSQKPLITPIQPSGRTAIPGFLAPNPNPLQFPTRPEEVDIEVTQPLTLQQAIELARRNNPDLQVAQLQLERAQAALGEARAGLFPTVDLDVTFSGGRSTGSEFQIEAARAEVSRQREAQRNLPPAQRRDIPDAPDERTSTQLNSTVGINYNIFTAGRVQAQIRAAQEQVRINQLQVESLGEQTRLDVSVAYYDLQQADEQVRISESAVRNAQRSLQDAQALFEAGLGTRFDVLRAQVQLARENQNLIRARSDRQIRRRDLARLLSLPQSVNMVAADPVAVAGLWNPTLEQSIVLAFQNRAELQQRLAERNVNREQRRIARSGRFPQLSLFFNYNLLDVFNDGLGLADGYSAGARLQWSIFDGGAANARAAQEEADIGIAETQFANQRNQIRFRVEQAYFTLQSSLENIQTASVALEQAAEALRLARLRFQAGVGTQTEVIDAENDLTSAEGDRVRAILDYNRALATLQREVSNLSATAP